METDNLVLEHLRAIRGTLDRVVVEISDIKGRLGVIEHGYSVVSQRLDRMDARLERVERRLDLIEA